MRVLTLLLGLLWLLLPLLLLLHLLLLLLLGLLLLLLLLLLPLLLLLLLFSRRRLLGSGRATICQTKEVRDGWQRDLCLVHWRRRGRLRSADIAVMGCRLACVVV